MSELQDALRSWLIADREVDQARSGSALADARLNKARQNLARASHAVIRQIEHPSVEIVYRIGDVHVGVDPEQGSVWRLTIEDLT